MHPAGERGPGTPLSYVELILVPLPSFRSPNSALGLTLVAQCKSRRVCAGDRSQGGSSSSHLQEVRLEEGGQTRGGGARCHGAAVGLAVSQPPPRFRSGIRALAGVRALSARWQIPAQILSQSPIRCSHVRSGSSPTATRRRAGSASVGTC